MEFDLSWAKSVRVAKEWTPDEQHYPDVVLDNYAEKSLKSHAQMWTPEVSPAAWTTEDFTRVALEANARRLELMKTLGDIIE